MRCAIFRSGGFAVGLSLLLLLAGGCGKSKSNDQAVGPERTNAPPSAATAGEQPSQVTRFHWLGKKKISADTNAAGVMKIWDLPESTVLENQTLDKLALAMAHQLPITNPPPALMTTNTPSVITNYHAFLRGASELLRPLLADVLQSECYLELHQPTNMPWALALAVRTGDANAAHWETNLAAALQLLGGSGPVPAPGGHGWQMQLADTRALFQGLLPRQSSILNPQSPILNHQSSIIEFARAGEWTLVGLVQAPNSALRTPNSALPAHPFLPELRTRLGSLDRNIPFSFWAPNNWLEAELDVAGLGPLFWAQASLFQNPPRISLSVAGDGENVLTRARLDFPKPLPYREEKWNIPTNLISQPLTSFTAMRGFAPWLASLEAWKDLSIGPPPNQFFIWALQVPVQTFFAAPQEDASNQVSRLTDLVLQKGAQYFATNDLAKFDRATDHNGLHWAGFPALTPYLRSIETNDEHYIFAGFFPAPDILSNTPPGLLQQIMAGTNVVYYDWELTGPRIEQWLYIGQFLRFVNYREQMPIELASRQWLKTVMLQLGNSGTSISLTAPNQLSFARRSGVGLTGIELNLLADWLEAPDFPRGLHSLVAILPEAQPNPALATGPTNSAQPTAPPKR
jgi:hypothetical protein